MKLKIGLVRVSSYAGKATFSHGATLLFTSLPVTVGRDVLIVDDILASGNTLRLVQSEIRRSGARSVKTAALLRGAPFFAQRRVGDGRFCERSLARESVPHPFLRKGWGTRGAVAISTWWT